MENYDHQLKWYHHFMEQERYRRIMDWGIPTLKIGLKTQPQKAKPRRNYRRGHLPEIRALPFRTLSPGVP